MAPSRSESDMRRNHTESLPNKSQIGPPIARTQGNTGSNKSIMCYRGVTCYETCYMKESNNESEGLRGEPRRIYIEQRAKNGVRIEGRSITCMVAFTCSLFPRESPLPLLLGSLSKYNPGHSRSTGGPDTFCSRKVLHEDGTNAAARQRGDESVRRCKRSGGALDSEAITLYVASENLELTWSSRGAHVELTSRTHLIL